MLQYHGGKIFGKAENDTNLLAETMFGLMISNLHGGPKFRLKMIPVTKLNAEFLRKKVYQTIYNIEAAFQHENKFLVAKWHHLRNLFQSEVCAVLKMV